MHPLLFAAAYAHVMFQNTFVNWYFLAPEFGVHRDVTKLVCTMCVIGGCMGCFLKTPWPVWLGAPVTMLDGLAKTLPDFFSFSTAGTPESCLYESMCGPKVGLGRGGRGYVGYGGQGRGPRGGWVGRQLAGVLSQQGPAGLWARLRCHLRVFVVAGGVHARWGVHPQLLWVETWAQRGRQQSSVCGVCVLLQVCTFSTPNHIAWMVPIMPQSYYLTG